MTSQEKILEILKSHQIVEITGDNPYEIVGFKCACNRGEPSEWFSTYYDDHLTHQSEQFNEVLQEERALELEEVISHTKYGWAIGSALENRAAIIRKLQKPFQQCDMCLGGGKRWHEELKARSTCSECDGRGYFLPNIS